MFFLYLGDLFWMFFFFAYFLNFLNLTWFFFFFLLLFQPTVYGTCPSTITVKDTDSGVTVLRDVHKCSAVDAKKMHTSPLALITGMVTIYSAHNLPGSKSGPRASCGLSMKFFRPLLNLFAQSHTISVVNF